jgi:Tfp pilus assembly protein PilF
VRSKRIVLLPLAAALLLLMPSLAHAQQARVYGKITDAHGNPVAGAKLTLEPMEGSGATVTATTNKKGSYMFGMVRPGRYRPAIDAVGLVIRHLKGKATDLDKKVQWALDGAVKPGEPPPLDLEDGYTVECDLALGPAVEMATGEGKTALLTPEEAVGELAKRVSQGDCKGAMPEIQKVLAATPDNATLNYLAGFCQAGDDRTDEAIASLTRALELQPNMAGAALLRGEVEARTGKLAEAEADFKREIAGTEEKKLVTDAWISLGILYRQQGKDADAVSAFQKVAELAPERPESYSELSALYTRMGHPEKAAEMLEQAKQAGGLDPAVLLNVGISYLNHKNYEQAEQFFRRAIEQGKKDPNEGMAWALLARCQLNAGKMDEGIASLKKSIDIDPKGNLADENREILKTLEKK